MVELGAAAVSSAAVNVAAASNANIATNNAPVSNAPVSNQVFSLSARILAARDTLPYTPAPANTNQQIDPAVLARVSLEEELKRRGGGGGGAPRFTSPTLFVLYSMRLINDAMREAYEALQKALDQGVLNAGAPINNALEVAQDLVGKFLATPTLVNLGTAINQSLAQIKSAFGDPATTASKLMNSAVHLGSVVASAIASGLKRLFYGKDEDRLDPDNELYQNEAGLLDKALSFFGMIDNQGSESNAKNIKAHIDNIANQVTRWARSINYPMKEFTERWFK